MQLTFHASNLGKLLPNHVVYFASGITLFLGRGNTGASR
jgi:hypothetical protein